jgi:hypothetical protein
MAELVSVSKVDVRISVTFTINEEEARALDALAGYGDQAAIDAFYKYCGSHYMKPYESGLRQFLVGIRRIVTPALEKADRARATLARNE